MGWVRVDDDFYDHAKFVDLSLSAMGLWVALLAWSNRNLKDGKIPHAIPQRLGATAEQVQELVDAGLLDVNCVGLEIHDYHDFQPSKDEVEAKRAEISEKRAEAGRKGAASRWQPDSKTEATEWPQPQTQLSTDVERAPKRSNRKPKVPIPIPFIPDQAVLEFGAREYPNVDLHHVAGKLVDWALKGDERAVDWQRALKVWIRREHERQQKGGWP